MRSRFLTLALPVLVEVFLVSTCGIVLNQGVSGTREDPSINGSLGSGWLHWWTYRKAHSIIGSVAGEQVDYPMKINVSYSNGLDEPNKVYVDGKCRTDFGDIRFTDSTGVNLLDYWMQTRVEGVQAIFWVNIEHIPQSPDCTTICIYYGNATATTTGNKNSTFTLASDFEDGTAQGWSTSWQPYYINGVGSPGFEGNYCRSADSVHGVSHGGNGYFYESYQQNVTITPGSYCIEGAARFSYQDGLQTPIRIRFLVGGVSVAEVSSPGTIWHWLTCNLTMNISTNIELKVEFHMFTAEGLGWGPQYYCFDSFLVQKWCDQEPAHSTWQMEQTISPRIFTVAWIPANPYPYIENYSLPRQWEPFLIVANISDDAGGSGLSLVRVCYRVDSSEWWNTTLAFNATTGFWTTKIPGQPGGSLVEFFVAATDKAGNTNVSGVDSYYAKILLLGDLNGDGKVDLKDVYMVHRNYGKTSP